MDPRLIPYLFPPATASPTSSAGWRGTNSARSRIRIKKWRPSRTGCIGTLDYLPGSTNASTSAYDTVIQRAGVCRDFAHLGIALCRALTIPARYFTAYAFDLQPPDFHAIFEAYIGNRWVLFDATRLVPLNGVVRIGSGRDAADAAVATIFGRVNCTSMSVSCTHADNNYKPLKPKDLKMRGISLDAA